MKNKAQQLTNECCKQAIRAHKIYLPKCRFWHAHPPKTFAKILPKPFQNPPKTHPKPSQKPSKTHLQKQTCPRRVSKSIFGASWMILDEFWEGPGPPEPFKMEPKSQKNAQNSIMKISMFFNTIFYRIFMVLASKNGFKIDRFSIMFWKRRFCENRAPVEAGARFLGCGASKKRSKIDAEIACEKQLPKSFSKIDFDLHFGLPKPPKIAPRSKKIASNIEPKKKLQPLSGRGARPNGLHPGNQAQEPC